ncbi:ferredoxin reductase [Thermomonospora umbrina]|uniref:Ferredoxin-NADP reductase n=1 Tax=Thermomonospora umbrina TaxID=111806 RepID=A0A3D9T2M5_9ACTN|nr:ferredoxin reductase [Thermomonospora umbrina]REE98081.1 ferredoxin-NADP reductase [Thermomonospora umbrina]
MTTGSGRWSDAGAMLGAAARWLTTPLLPEDYLGWVNPLWSAAQLRGRVEAVRAETADSATLLIRPGRAWAPHRPGQWVRVGVDIGGVRHWRTFSLSSPPRRDGRITITVKAGPDGFVSSHLVRRTRPDTLVHLGLPDGRFVLPARLPRRALFVTAGSGVTPVMAMLAQLAAAGMTSDVVLIHSAPTRDDVIFGTALRAMAARFPTMRLHERHTREHGRLKAADIPELCEDWADRPTWACGPPGFLADLAEHWDTHGIGAALRQESFHPLRYAEDDGDGGRVRFTLSGKTAEAEGGTPLLETGEAAGVLMPSGCRMGICRSCLTPLGEGTVRDLRTGELTSGEGKYIQTCISTPVGPVELRR